MRFRSDSGMAPSTTTAVRPPTSWGTDATSSACESFGFAAMALARATASDAVVAK